MAFSNNFIDVPALPSALQYCCLQGGMKDLMSVDCALSLMPLETLLDDPSGRERAYFKLMDALDKMAEEGRDVTTNATTAGSGAPSPASSAGSATGGPPSLPLWVYFRQFEILQETLGVDVIAPDYRAEKYGNVPLPFYDMCERMGF
jgi:hypothetical protein